MIALFKMSKERTQLNVNIDPELLLKLKSQAIKNGKTLTEFVVSQLKHIPEEISEDTLEKRLLRIEKILFMDKPSSYKGKKIGTIFTDKGAREYGEIAKSEF